MPYLGGGQLDSFQIVIDPDGGIAYARFSEVIVTPDSYVVESSDTKTGKNLELYR